MKNTLPRYHEIDILRGIAIILMIIFHLLWDLNFFGYMQIDLWSGVWLYIGRVVQCIFIFTTGLTLAISYDAALLRGKMHSILSRVLHAAKILSIALIITAITWLMFKGDMITFGILHFMGVSIMLSLLFLPLRRWNILIGTSILLVSPFIIGVSLDPEWLSFLGVNNMQSTALDYFPLFPWFGLFLIGVGSHSYLYPKAISYISRSFLHSHHTLNLLSYLGQRSLWIYIIHQPLLFGIIWCISQILQTLS